MNVMVEHQPSSKHEQNRTAACGLEGPGVSIGSSAVSAELSVPAVINLDCKSLDKKIANTPSAGRRGRRSRFTSTDDLYVLREVLATKAYVAPNGKNIAIC